MTVLDKIVAVLVAVLIPFMLLVGGEFLYHRHRPNIRARKPFLFAGTVLLQSVHLLAVLMRNEHLYDVFAPQVFEFDHCLFWDYWIKNTFFNLWVVALNYRTYFYGTLEADITTDKRNLSKHLIKLTVLLPVICMTTVAQVFGDVQAAAIADQISCRAAFWWNLLWLFFDWVNLAAALLIYEKMYRLLNASDHWTNLVETKKALIPMMCLVAFKVFETGFVLANVTHFAFIRFLYTLACALAHAAFVAQIGVSVLYHEFVAKEPVSTESLAHAQNDLVGSYESWIKTLPKGHEKYSRTKHLFAHAESKLLSDFQAFVASHLPWSIFPNQYYKKSKDIVFLKDYLYELNPMIEVLRLPTDTTLETLREKVHICPSVRVRTKEYDKFKGKIPLVKKDGFDLDFGDEQDGEQQLTLVRGFLYLFLDYIMILDDWEANIRLKKKTLRILHKDKLL